MLTKKNKVLFVTSLFSPFQVELAYEINKLNLFDYYVAFTVPYSARRGKHWIIKIKEEYAKFIMLANNETNVEAQAFWAAQTIIKLNPQIVILGFYKGSIYKQSIDAAKSIKADIGFWCEPPNLLYPNLIIKIYQNLILKRNLKDAKFILAIGDRATRIYKEIYQGDVHTIPYGQDLSSHFSIHRNPKSDDERIVFLFSGQLVKRHNIQLIAKSLIKLYERYPDKFKFVIAGYGPMEDSFWQIIKRKSRLRNHIIYDRDYETWEDRVRPFSYSDVLIYPSRHSGWGLVIPEAMASGMLVISTPYVEAARYYIVDGKNGIIIEPTIENLITKMEWCIINKEKIFRIGQQARIDALKGTAEYVAKQFCDVVKQYLLLPRSVTLSKQWGRQ